MCNHTKVYYQETMYWWPIGYPSWLEQKTVDFECKLMDFANNKIRIQHYIPYKWQTDVKVRSNFQNTD